MISINQYPTFERSWAAARCPDNDKYAMHYLNQLTLLRNTHTRTVTTV